ncbi:hypothetical protein BHE74_00057933, partial [Ensete ventricosum]
MLMITEGVQKVEDTMSGPKGWGDESEREGFGSSGVEDDDDGAVCVCVCVKDSEIAIGFNEWSVLFEMTI